MSALRAIGSLALTAILVAFTALAVYVASAVCHILWMIVDDNHGHGEQAMKREAVRHGFAHWRTETDEDGHTKTTFEWNQP